MEGEWGDVNFYRQQLRMTEPESSTCEWENTFKFKNVKNQEAM